MVQLNPPFNTSIYVSGTVHLAGMVAEKNVSPVTIKLKFRPPYTHPYSATIFHTIQ